MVRTIASALFVLFSAQTSHALLVKAIDLRRMNASEIAKVGQVVDVLNLVVNSEEFKTRVLNFKYNGLTQFANNRGLTNQQIYDTLIAGEEEFPKPVKANQQADLYISMYDPPWYRRQGLAFTYPRDRYMYIYRKYFGSGTMPALSNTFIHEWTHKIGFEHDYRRTTRRPYSVPYGVGGIVEAIASKWAGIDVPEGSNDWDEDAPEDAPPVN